MDLFKEDNVVNKIMYHIELFAVDTEHNLNSNLAILKDLKNASRSLPIYVQCICYIHVHCTCM